MITADIDELSTPQHNRLDEISTPQHNSLDEFSYPNNNKFDEIKTPQNIGLDEIKKSAEKQIDKYFDEMFILASDKKKRKKTADDMFWLIYKFFLNQKKDIKDGTYLHERTSDDYISDLYMIYKRSIPFDIDKADKRALDFAVYIETSTERAIAAISDEMFLQALSLGLLIAILPKEVETILGSERAIIDAENETNYINAYVSHEELKKTSKTHTWVTCMDGKERTDHAKADNQTKLIDEPFIVGGYKMMHPMDDSLGAPLTEIINCRCIEL